jgi:hypothetical protein
VPGATPGDAKAF